MPGPRRLIFAPEVAEVARVLHPSAKRKVREAVETIRVDPQIGDELVRELNGLRRLRVGRLRIVYRAEPRHVQIVAIGPRATIYVELTARRRLGRDAE